MICLVWLFGFVGSLSYFTGMCCAGCCMGYLCGLYSSCNIVFLLLISYDFSGKKLLERNRWWYANKKLLEI